MEKPFYTVEDLSYELNLSTEDIDRLFIIGKLKPSICLKSTPMALLDNSGTKIISRVDKYGIFDIMEYQKINWRSYAGGYGILHCSLLEDKIKVSQDGEIYGFTTNVRLNADDIIITHENVKGYKSRNDNISTPINNAAHSDTLHPRKEKTLLTIIAAMLDVITGEYCKGANKHPDIKNQSELVTKLVDLGLPGLSKSNLEKYFAMAREVDKTTEQY